MYRISAPAPASGPFWKSGHGQNFDRIWPYLGQLFHMVIFLTTANSTGTSTGIFHLCE